MVGQSFKDLAVWQRGIELTVAVNKLTSVFPDTEKFGLTNQIRRAAVSIASNLPRDMADPREVSIFSFSDTREVHARKLKPRLSLRKNWVSVRRSSFE